MVRPSIDTRPSRRMLGDMGRDLSFPQGFHGCSRAGILIIAQRDQSHPTFLR